MKRPAVFLLLVSLANAQCSNYGDQNGSACLCPTGFGGSTCASPGCGGDIFQGANRALAPQQNVSDASCACEAGWGGTGCNVCSSSLACQKAYSASGSAPSDSQTITGSQSGQNITLTCNSAARVYAASQMSCEVNVSIDFRFFIAGGLELCLNWRNIGTFEAGQIKLGYQTGAERCATRSPSTQNARSPGSNLQI
jgi:hypothetical protein